MLKRRGHDRRSEGCIDMTDSYVRAEAGNGLLRETQGEVWVDWKAERQPECVYGVDLSACECTCNLSRHEAVMTKETHGTNAIQTRVR